MNRFARLLLEIKTDLRLALPLTASSSVCLRQSGTAASIDGVVSGSSTFPSDCESILLISHFPISLVFHDSFLLPSNILSYSYYKKPSETYVLLPENAA
jgi:hypothetical protein